jgi:hypothetical protein
MYLDDTKRARSLTIGAASGSWPAAISTAAVAIGYIAPRFFSGRIDLNYRIMVVWQ